MSGSVLANWGCAIVLVALGAASGLAVYLTDERLSPERSWILIVLGVAAVLFAIAGAARSIVAFRTTLSARTVETVVEVPKLDLEPGTRTSLYVTQKGPVELNQLRVLLCCTETETVTREYDEIVIDPDSPIDRKVTRTSVENNELLHETVVLERQALLVDDRFPFEATIQLDVPIEALPTGKSSRRERFTAEEAPWLVPVEATAIRQRTDTVVEWAIVVTGDVRGRVDFEHEFPLVVYPRAVDGNEGLAT